MENGRSKKALWISWSLTVLIWVASGPLTIPGLSEIPLQGRGLASGVFILIQLLGPGRYVFKGCIPDLKDLNRLPLLLNSWAVLLTLLGSVLAYLTGASRYDFHSAAFLISFYLSVEYALTSLIRWDRLQALRQLNLTKAMADKLKDAEASTPPLIYRSFRKVPYIFAAIGIVALLAGALWSWDGGLNWGLVRAATVLAVGSPLIWLRGLPASFRMALRAAAYQQVLIGSATGIEIATRLDAVIFGKRGTLTHGSPRVTDVIPMMNIDEEELMLWAASAEHGSQHPFGQAIVNEAESQEIPLEPPERFTEMSGRGVECIIDGQQVRLGKPAFFDKEAIPAYLADRLEIIAQEGKTPFMCCRENEFLGIIAVTEEVRPEAAAAIESIRSLGLRTIMMTGDDRMMSESLAERLHIDQVIAEVLSENKSREINKLRREGFRVGMVGAYPEDNESFEESELGITLTRGKGRELPPTDVIILEDNLQHVVSFFEVSHRAMRIVRENRLFSYFYHVFAVLFAAGFLVPFGYSPLSPTGGAVLSGLSLGLAMMNSRRMSR